MHTTSLFLLLSACAPEQGLSPDPATPDDPVVGDSGDPVADSASPGGGDEDSASDTATTDTGTPLPQVTRFVALGDAGTGDDKQRRVAAGIGRVCAEVTCDFAVYLGDNFYSDGVTGVDDPKWQDVFETPYASLDLPFWAVLGNHDYGGNGGGWEPYRTDAQVAYTQYSAKWHMPDQSWATQLGIASVFGLDTNALAWERGADQIAWFPGARDASLGPWRIVLGHHTYVSNGPHGNAGDWDGGNGGRVFKSFFDAELCGKVDLYLGGHDHSLQWPVSPCAGTEFVVTGAGGKTSSVSGSNDAWFESAQLGFFVVELRADAWTGTFYDADGNALYTREVPKAPR